MDSERARPVALHVYLFVVAFLLLSLSCGAKAQPEDGSAPAANPAAPSVTSVPSDAPEIAQPEAAQPEAATPETAVAVVSRAVRELSAMANALVDDDAMAEFDKRLVVLSAADLDAALALLETALAEAERQATPVPSLRLALAACYGRKGLAAKAYAAVLAAEKDAGAPGVSFGLSVIHGRKALLAPPADTKPCTLVVESEPPGADVAVDGRSVGKSPARLEALRPGSHEVRVALDGYVEYTGLAEAGPGATLTVRAVLDPVPKPLPAILIVESEPSGGVVEFFGKERGRTPLRIETMTFEARYVSIRALDIAYESSGPLPVTLRPGEETRISHRFSKKGAPLSLKVSAGSPEGAVVLVDGKRFDTIPTSDRVLEFGEHEIEILAEGYDPIKKRVSWDGLWGRRLAMTRRLPLVERGALRVDGAAADWAGIAPLFVDPEGDDPEPRMSGTDIVAVYAASDGEYLYVRMDFADGLPRSDSSGWKEQALKIHGDRDGSSQYYIFLSVGQFTDRLEAHVRVRKNSGSSEKEVKRTTTGCSYRNGEGLVEMRFPFSAFAGYVKQGDVFNFWSHVGHGGTKGMDDTDRVDVRIR